MDLLLLENVLGVEGNSQDVIASILTEVRLSTGSACTTVMRQFLKKFTEHCKNVSVGGVSIIESDSALTKIGDVSFRKSELGGKVKFFIFSS